MHICKYGERCCIEKNIKVEVRHGGNVRKRILKGRLREKLIKVNGEKNIDKKYVFSHIPNLQPNIYVTMRSYISYIENIETQVGCLGRERT